MPSEEPLVWAWTTDEETWHFADGEAEARSDLLDSADAGWIGLVRRKNIRLVDMLPGIDWYLGYINECAADGDLCDPNDNKDLFDLTTEQKLTLQRDIQEAVEKWQTVRSLKFYEWAVDIVHTERIVSNEIS